MLIMVANICSSRIGHTAYLHVYSGFRYSEIITPVLFLLWPYYCR